MYSREKHFRQEETPKSKKSHRNTPSFSSSLLDEICRSIDDKLPDPKTPNSAAVSLSKVEKWIESAPRRRPKSDNAVFPDTDPSTSHRPKPVRTSREKDSYLFDDYEAHERRHRAAAEGEDNQQHLIKSKSRAMRIYSNLRRMKQPVSPGARLTTFFASIFSGLGRKKAPKSPPEKTLAACSTKCSSKISHHETEIERRSSQSQLDLARALVDRDAAVPRVNRSLGCGGGRPPLPPSAVQKNQKNRDLNKSRYKIYDEDEDEEEDAISESSSDLFELDHSSLFAIRDRLCEELPVYETTYFDKNRRLFR